MSTPTTPHRIKTYLKATETRLRSADLGVGVEYFPEQPEKYVLRHPRAALLVSAVTRNYQSPASTSSQVARYTLRIQITVVARSLLADDHGAYDLLDNVYDTMTKSPLFSNIRAYPEREFFLSRDGDIWRYAAIYFFKSIRI